MKRLCFFAPLVLLAASCLKSLDDGLHTNPLDADYTGDYIIIDEVTFQDTNNLGEAGCNPIVKFHLDPQTADRLERVEIGDYTIVLKVKFKRTSPISGAVQNRQVFGVKIQDLVADSVYTVKYNSSSLNGYDDLICPEIYITAEAQNSNMQIPLISQSASQFTQCFVCGG